MKNPQPTGVGDAVQTPEVNRETDLTANIHVLCVDDDPDILNLTATYLEREHDEIDVVTTTDPTEALDLLTDMDVSCIVSDYQMPDRDGIELLRTVRETHTDLPFILYTGKGSEAVASEAIDAGVTDYLQKETGPEQYEILANKIEQAVSAHRARRELTDREEQFRKLVEGSTDLISILDPDGTFAYISPSSERIMGYRPPELVGENAFDRMHPDDQEAILEKFEKLVADPTYTPTEEFRYKHADGSWRWLEAHGRNLLDDPTIGGIIVNARDVTERKEVHRRYQTLFEQSPAGVAVLEESGDLKHVSATIEEITGYDEGDLIGRDAFEFVHADDREETVEQFMTTLETDETRDVEYRVVRPDGEVRWVRATGRDLRDDPAVEGFVVNVLDVTERKDREHALRDEREFIDTVLDTLGDIVYVVDTDGQLVRWNERASAVTGYSDTELADLDPLELFDDDDHEAVNAGMAEVLETGRTSGKYKLETKDGDRIPYEFRSRRLETPDGEVRGFCGVGRDISDRVQRDRELERFETAVEAVQDGIYIIDADGRYEYVNQAYAENVGLDRDELIGEEVPLFMDESEIEETEAAIREMLQGKRDSARHETEVTTATGETIAVENRYTILPTDDGYRGTVGVMRNITDRKEREQELERFETLVETVADGVSFVDTDGRYTYVNRYIEEKTGYDREELVGEPPTKLMDDETVERFEDGIRQMLAGDGDSFQIEFEVSPKAADPYPVETKVAPLLDDGSFEGHVSISRDITERRERERELERFETITDAAGDGIFVLDGDGCFTEVNDYILEQTGYDREALIGSHVSELIPEEGVERGTELVGELLADPDRKTATHETEVETAGGETLPIEVRLALITGADGSFRRTVGVAREISERKARERELERYEVLLEEVADGVSFVDADGRYTYVNSYLEEKMGYDRDELIGESPRKIMSEAVVEEFEEGIRRTLAGEHETFTTEYQVHPADGEPYPVETKVAPLVDDGAFRGTVSVTRDITERKDRERELQRRNERLDEFTSVVSHDLRNPLNVATGRLELAQDECDSDQLDAVAQALDRMEGLIGDLLTMAQKGQTIGETDPIDVARVARDAWETVETGNASLQTEETPTIQADAERLAELLENLFRNAVQHGGTDVTVAVGATTDGFYVEDDGGGFETDDTESLFDRGYTTTEGGNGFGLSIVRTIARAHDWAITATESDTGGARFEVTGVRRA